jgi:cation:H+ antiporter
VEIPALLGIILVGLAVVIYASSRAVRYAKSLAFSLKVPPFFIGMTLLSFGTDLPEIANSISASLQGHGDVNVGDSIGSAVAQLTLVMGLLPIIAGGFRTGRGRIPLIGALTVASLALGAYLLSDGLLSRLDGILLVSMWAVSTFVVLKSKPPAAEPTISVEPGNPVKQGLLALVFLALVAGGAWFAIDAFIELTSKLGAPRYLVSFFALSLGTSLPELVVDLTALRSGQKDLAIGGLLGASLVDSSLSIGTGPIFAPNVVTADLVVRGNITAAIVVAIVVTILSLRERIGRPTGVLFVLLFFAFIPAIVPDVASTLLHAVFPPLSP